jgi:thiamine-phosphate pyrophosphorylase
LADDNRFVYLISPEAVTTPAALDQFAAALEAALATDHAALFQLRLKNVSDDWLETATARLLPLCQSRNVPFLMNDRADLAVKFGCDGVHVSPDDMDFAKVRSVIGADLIFGATCRASRDLAFEAGEADADYVAFGAFFPSTTKDPKSFVGTEILEWWSGIATLPSCAIGGINAQNCRPLREAGADLLAVVSAVWDYPEGPAAGVNALVEACT